MTRLAGGPELRARLRDLRKSFRPIGRRWGDETVRLARERAPERTGKLRSSLRVRNNTQKRTTVVAVHYGKFVDQGTKAHEIRPRHKQANMFTAAGGRTIFAKRILHRGNRASQFAARSAREAVTRTAVTDEIVRAWNDAA